MTPAKVKAALGAVETELRGAIVQHGPIAGPHEGYAVTLEELDKLWAEIKLKHPDRAHLYTKAARVAAMAVRLMVDVCDPSDGRTF